MHNKHIQLNKGFTLVEVIVAIGIFLVVMTISLGAILTVVDAGRKSRNLKTVMTNLNFALEAMSREIKFGKEYYCGVNTSTSDPNPTQSCSGGGNPPDTAITFTNSDGDRVIYRLNGSMIERSSDADPGFGSIYRSVTSPDITIEHFRFYVLGAEPGDTIQPRALISIRGYAGEQPSSQSRFMIQTTVSQRALDS